MCMHNVSKRKALFVSFSANNRKPRFFNLVQKVSFILEHKLRLWQTNELKETEKQNELVLEKSVTKQSVREV